MSSTAVISSKGQLVIPAEIRRKYGLRAGVTVVFHDEHGRLTLEANSFEAVLALRGSIKGRPLVEELEAQREAERRREDSR